MVRRPACATTRRVAVSEAGSPLPFPLRRGEFRLTRRHGAGVHSTRPHLCLGPEPSTFPKSIVNPRIPQDPQAQLALGKAIRALRNRQGDSQEKLAKAAGITPNMMSLIERGEGNPSWVTIKGIAGALGVSVSTLAKAAEKLEK